MEKKISALMTPREVQLFDKINEEGGEWGPKRAAVVLGVEKERAQQVMRSMAEKGYLEVVRVGARTYRLNPGWATGVGEAAVEEEKVVRFVIKQGDGGLCHVWDSLKGQLARVTPHLGAASEMCNDLNRIHESSVAWNPAVSAETAARVREMVREGERSAGSSARLAGSLAASGHTISAAVEESDAEEYRASAAALRELLGALGISTEDE